jgi:hypothetical protein
MATHPLNARYPDTTAITYDEQNFKVTVIYNDHSIYVWDVRDIKKVSAILAFTVNHIPRRGSESLCRGQKELCTTTNNRKSLFYQLRRTFQTLCISQEKKLAAGYFRPGQVL